MSPCDCNRDSVLVGVQGRDIDIVRTEIIILIFGL